MGDHAAAARDLLMRAAVLREDGTTEAMSEARDLVAAAHVHALLAQASVTSGSAVRLLPVQNPADEPPPVSRLILDTGVVAYGELVNAHDVVNRLRARGHDAAETTVSNELGRAARRGEYLRVRRGWFSRTRP